jgi:oligosaccharide repeat unit polymerase
MNGMLNKITFFLILAFVLPIFLLLSNDNGLFSVNFFYIYLLLLWSTFRIFFCGLIGEKKLSLLFFYVFVYVFLTVQPMLSIWVGNFPHGNSYMSNDLIFYTITFIFIGVMSFEFSYNILKYIFKRKSSNYLYKPLNNNFFIKRSYQSLIVILIIFLITIPIYGPYLFLGIRDGGLNLGESRGIERSIIVDLLLVFGLRSFAAVILFKVLFKIKYEPASDYKNKYRYLLFFCILINIIISNPLNAPRLWTGAMILTSFFISRKWNSGSFSKIYFYFSLILLLLFSGTDPRIIIGRQLLNDNEITINGTLTEITNSFKRLPYDYNFDSFQVISFTKIYCDNNGYSYGKQLLLPIFFWVPRSFWPSKPIGTSDMIAASFDLPNLNISAPFWCEAYVNFGILGIVIFFFFLGVAANIIDSKLITNKTSQGTLIFSSFFACNMIILLRGDLTTGTQYLQVMILFIFLINKFIFKKYIF